MKRREFIASLGSSVVAWPVAARAQNAPQLRRLAVLMSIDEGNPQAVSSIKALVGSLAQLGWTTSKNIEIRYWWGLSDPDLMATNAREAVGYKPDVLLVMGANLPAAHRATSTMPIVFVMLSDVVAEHYVQSFARPNGNLTGFTSYERSLVGKRLTLLKEVSPETRRVLYIRSRKVGADTAGLFEALIADARSLDLSVIDGASEDDAEIERNMEAFGRQPNGGLIAAFDAFVTVHHDKLIELAARYRLPAVYPLPLFVQSGGLLSYGFDQDDEFHQAAGYVARILGGEKPSELPVQAPTKFKMLINLKTANALGLTVPQILLATADKVIE
jgi:putative ABC transport system substrate-binding protein